MLGNEAVYLEIHSQSLDNPNSKGRPAKVSATAFEIFARNGLLEVHATSDDDGTKPGRHVLTNDGGPSYAYERTAVLKFEPQELAKVLHAAMDAGLITFSVAPKVPA